MSSFEHPLITELQEVMARIQENASRPQQWMVPLMPGDDSQEILRNIRNSPLLHHREQQLRHHIQILLINHPEQLVAPENRTEFQNRRNAMESRTRELIDRLPWMKLGNVTPDPSIRWRDQLYIDAMERLPILVRLRRLKFRDRLSEEKCRQMLELLEWLIEHSIPIDNEVLAIARISHATTHQEVLDACTRLRNHMHASTNAEISMTAQKILRIREIFPARLIAPTTLTIAALEIAESSTARSKAPPQQIIDEILAHTQETLGEAWNDDHQKLLQLTLEQGMQTAKRP